jgi:hypothetical protein
LIDIYNKRKISSCTSKHTKEEEAYHVGVYNKTQEKKFVIYNKTHKRRQR